MIFHDRLVAQLGQVSGPQPEREGPLPTHERFDRALRGRPESGNAPPPRGRPDLRGIRLSAKRSRVDQVSCSPKRLMRPSVRSEEKCMVRRSRCKDSVHPRPVTGLRGDRCLQQLVDRRGTQVVRPLRLRVHLDVQRRAPPHRREVVNPGPNAVGVRHLLESPVA